MAAFMTDPAARSVGHDGGAGARSIPELLAAGEAALAAGRYREAAECLEPVADAMPDHVPLVRMAATAWQLAGQRSRARAVLTRVTDRAIDVLSANDAHALGAQLLDVGAPDRGLYCFTQVARSLPNHPAVLGALAGARRAQGELDDAWRLVQRATTADRQNPVLWLTAAQVRHGQGQLDEALKLLKKAESLRPSHPPTRLQRALTRLLAGASTYGWGDFEHRGLPSLPTGRTAWRGEPLDGRSILVVSEQGIGDLFHFLRFVPLLTGHGAGRIVVEAPRSAVSLLQASGFDAVPVGEAPPTDFAVPVLSLPLHLGTDKATYGDLVPYLRTGAAADAPAPTAVPTPVSSAPATREGPAPLRRRLGLVLRGNPNFLATNLRDIGNEWLGTLQSIPNVDWVWLQLGEAPPEEFRCEKPKLSENWLETALLLQSLDGIVSVDTGLAHLAGAMGLPVWVLLPFSPDWRWGLQGESTPWYPSATLARQSAPRDWGEAIARLSHLLDPPGRERR